MFSVKRASLVFEVASSRCDRLLFLIFGGNLAISSSKCPIIWGCIADYWIRWMDGFWILINRLINNNDNAFSGIIGQFEKR